MTRPTNPEAPERPVRLTVAVSGRVQGVGYRRFAQRRAADLGLAGYAENVSGGKVEVVAEGPRPDLERLLHLLGRGPAHAQVEGVEAQWSEATGLSGFYVY